MIVAFDNTFFTLVISPGTRPTPDPVTGAPTSYCGLKIEALIDKHTKARDQVIIPTPSLAEALVIAPDAERILRELQKIAGLEPAPFDVRSALELARMTQLAIASGDKRGGAAGAYQLVKLDRQIVAIAKAHGASILYTDDPRQTTFANAVGLEVVHTWDLPLPPEYQQRELLRDDNGE